MCMNRKPPLGGDTQGVRKDAVTCLAESDPGRSIQLSESTARMFVKETIATSKRTRRGNFFTRHKRASGVLLLVIALVGPPGVAFGSGYIAQTGLFGNPVASTEENDSEYINTGAKDYDAYAVRQWPSYIHLPDKYDQVKFASATATYLKPPGGALVQKSSLVWTFEDAARYSWMREWLDADESGDRQAAERAARVLKEASGWQATVQSDGGGVVAHFSEVAEAAAHGERSVVADDAKHYAGYDEKILGRAL